MIKEEREREREGKRKRKRKLLIKSLTRFIY